MSTPPALPAAILAQLIHTDPAAPRITCYDDATGERVELSAKTLANWVAKAANLLQEDADATVGSTVGLALPPHWRALTWALAAWHVGATVVVGPEAATAGVVVTDDPQVAAAALDGDRYAVLVTLDALARSNDRTPQGAVDAAKELASYGDHFTTFRQPQPLDPGLTTPAGTAAYEQLVERPDWPPHPRVRVTGDLAQVLLDSLAAWACGGSVVLLLHPSGDQARRLADERVTVDLG